MSRVDLDVVGEEVDPHAVAPGRVVLPARAVERVADLGGVPSPAVQMVPTTPTTPTATSLARRLAGPHADDTQWNGPVPVQVQDVDALLAGAGLVAAGGLTVTGRAVLDVWQHPAVAVELEMLLATRRGSVRLRSWHRQLGAWVVCLSTADARGFELTWLAADDWWLELGRAAWVDPRWFPVTGPCTGLPDVVETPWELLLATGEAVGQRRDGLVADLVAHHAGRTAAGPSIDAVVQADDDDVRRWHEVLAVASHGRLHAAVLGRSERGHPGAGAVEWVLLHDGWRSLTPLRRDGCSVVRVERRGPQDLGRDLAALAARVTT